MQDYGLSKLAVKIEAPVKKMDYRVARFVGDMDKVGLESERNVLENCVDTLEESYLVFDYTALNYINSEGIGFLLTLHLRLTKKNKTLVVVNARANVKDVLEVIGMFSMIKYFDSLKAFEESLKK